MEPRLAHFQPAVKFFQICTTELRLGLEPRSLHGMPEATKLAKALAVLRSLGSFVRLSSRVVRKLVIAWSAPR
jgi:hypothetical protein